MEQFPKIARARMAAHAAGDHPEAEQLNAFAENVLGVRERESVLAHLTTCADCRETVALAVQTRPEGAPLVKPARSGFRWATFQWAAIAASVAIVTVAVLVVGPKENRVAQHATESAAVQREAPEPQVPKAPESPVAGLKSGRDASSKADANIKTRAAGKEVAGGTGAVSGGGDGGAITDGGFGGIGVYSRSAGQKTASRDDALAKLQEKKEAGAAQLPKGAPSRDLAYSAPALNANDTFYSSVPASRPAQESVAGKIAQNMPPPAPAVDGERARAEEQGKASNEISKDKRRDAAAQASTESVEMTSQAAAVSPTPAAPAAIKTKSSGADLGVLSRTYAPTSRMWRLQSGKLESSDDGGQAWQVRPPAKDFQAMSVAAVGQQVWAGGKAGALFLSHDNGKTWTKVSLTGDDIIPLGDVTEIKVTSAQLVDVILSSGDDWQTNDGGKSFRLLPRKP